MKEEISHPLAAYASDWMVNIWSDAYRFEAERDLWLQVMTFQFEAGVFDGRPEDPREVLQAYTAVRNRVDMGRIREREWVTRHDLKARIEVFNEQASEVLGCPLEYVHVGMTSADVVDNISLIQIMCSLWELSSDLGHESTADPDMLGVIRRSLPFRGIKGPVGTQQDQLDLLGSIAKCEELDRVLANSWGFADVMNSVGQVYPRSLDFNVMAQVRAAIAPYVHKHPHWRTITNGYIQMAADYSGSQWNEGDVSTSVTRRVCLPGFFLAADAALLEGL